MSARALLLFLCTLQGGGGKDVEGEVGRVHFHGRRTPFMAVPARGSGRRGSGKEVRAGGGGRREVQGNMSESIVCGHSVSSGCG